MSEALDKILALREDPYAYARAWKERTHGAVLGFFCCYAPEELIHASGALPVRITGEDRDITESGAHLQNYCCSLARTGLDMALTGDLAFMDGTVFVHTCDTMMRLSDIWRLEAGFSIHLDTVLPVRFEGPASEEYVYEELSSFKRRLEERCGPVFDEKLAKSIALYIRNRELLAELYAMRRADPAVLPCDQALWVVASSALMEKSEHNKLLEELLTDVKAEAESPSPSRGEGRGEGVDKVRLFGIGSVMDQYGFLEMLEQVGGTLVDDDFCTGHRYFDTLVPDNEDALQALATRLMDRAVCPCKHQPSRDRAASLVQRLQAADAVGALFFYFKFCEPHAFDYPHLKAALDEAGVPSLLLEIEQGSVSIEQLRTRVEALLETIRG